MKYLLFALLTISVAATTQAQDRWLYWKYKDYDGSVTFTVPRVAIGTGSLFIKQKSERKMLRRVHKVRTMIFEDGSPLADQDIKRFTKGITSKKSLLCGMVKPMCACWPKPPAAMPSGK
jgi:hypothetical protein